MVMPVGVKQLSELVYEKFGIRTRAKVNPVTASLGITAALALKSNPNRLAWLLINLSANVVYIGFSRDVSSTKGIRLNANGGQASMIWDEDFDITGWEIYGVAAGANSAIFCYEVESY
jgi:hypothetical protein